MHTGQAALTLLVDVLGEHGFGSREDGRVLRFVVVSLSRRLSLWKTNKTNTKANGKHPDQPSQHTPVAVEPGTHAAAAAAGPPRSDPGSAADRHVQLWLLGRCYQNLYGLDFQPTQQERALGLKRLPMRGARIAQLP